MPNPNQPVLIMLLPLLHPSFQLHLPTKPWLHPLKFIQRGQKRRRLHPGRLVLDQLESDRLHQPPHRQLLPQPDDRHPAHRPQHAPQVRPHPLPPQLHRRQVRVGHLGLGPGLINAGEFVQSSRKEDHSLKQDGLSQQRTHGITVLAQCGRPEVFGDS